MPDRTKKIRVALMSYAIDNRQAKGTAVYARRLIEHLLDDPRFEFTLVHYDQVDDPIYRRGAKEIIMPGRRIPSRFLRQLLFFWKYRRERFDIIHWFQPRAYPGYWWAPARRKVITIHGGGKYFYPRFNVSARVFDLMVRYLNFWFDVMIVGTEASRREALETYRVRPDQVRATYYGGGERFSRLDPTEAFALVSSHYPQIDRPYILNVSRIQPHKNLARLIEAYDLVRRMGQRDDKLVIVGWPTEQVEAVYGAARQSRYAKDIVFIDYVADEVLNPLYSAATVFVFPSLNEGFGLPLVEAMAGGAPVLTSNIGCMPEVVGEAGLTADPYRPIDLAEKMAVILTDRSVRERLIELGHERVSHFTWRQTAIQTMEIYSSLITDHV